MGERVPGGRPAPGWRLRWAREEDLPAILAIERASFPMPWAPEHFASELERGSFFLVACQDEEVLGYLVAWDLGDWVYIANLAVAPRARRRGVGRSLVAECIAWARSLGRKGVSLDVREKNRAARALYRSMGFSEVARLPRHYGDEDGIRCALILSE